MPRNAMQCNVMQRDIMQCHAMQCNARYMAWHGMHGGGNRTAGGSTFKCVYKQKHEHLNIDSPVNTHLSIDIHTHTQVYRYIHILFFHKHSHYFWTHVLLFLGDGKIRPCLRLSPRHSQPSRQFSSGTLAVPKFCAEAAAL